MTDVSLRTKSILQSFRPRASGFAQSGSAAEILTVCFLCSVILGQIARIPVIATETKTAPILLSDILAGCLSLWLLASVLVVGRMRLDWTARLLAGFVA